MTRLFHGSFCFYNDFFNQCFLVNFHLLVIFKTFRVSIFIIVYITDSLNVLSIVGVVLEP